MILSGLLLSFSIYIKIFKNDILDKKIQINYVFIILSFLLSFLISDSSFSDTYTYKSSSYIWVIFYFFRLSVIRYNFDKKILKAFTPLPFVVYFIQVLLPKNIQNIIEDFFYTYSDKLEFQRVRPCINLCSYNFN